MKEKTIYALGFFDGVHIGHQALLHACQDLAQRHAAKAGVVTFTGHPDTLVFGKTPGLINTSEDRKQLLLSMGIDCVRELPFDSALMATSWQDFLAGIPNAAGFVCGSDFRFGAGGKGTAETLVRWCEERKLPCAVVPQQELDGIRISSTYIRELLASGDVEQANRYLGHPHLLTGEVVHGRGLGRTIQVPTANLLLPTELLVLKHGVYACKATVDGQKYLAVTNIGARPTVDGHQVRAESWLLDFAGDLYGKTLSLDFYKFLRPEKKFSSLEELTEEIRKNAQQTRDLLEKT